MVVGSFSGLAHIASLESENHRLKDEVQGLRNEAVRGRLAESQNKELRDLMKIQGQLGLRGISATVIGPMTHSSV